MSSPLILISNHAVSYALSQQLIRFAEPHDTFVNRWRDFYDERPDLQSIEMTQRQKLGEEVGERQWARRGVEIPLGIINLVLSFLLFAGALEAMRGRHWGHGAWEWAARLSIPYTVLATVLSVAQARDLSATFQASMRVFAGATGYTSGALAAMAIVLYQAVSVAIGLLLVGYYLACVLYLRRPNVRALYPAPPPRA